MTAIRLLQMGLGSVGSAFLRQFLALDEAGRRGLVVAGIADSSGLVWDEDGLAEAQLRSALATKQRQESLGDHPGSAPLDAIDQLVKTEAANLIVLDLTASESTVPILLEAARSGCGVVLANKKPLAAEQSIWDALKGDGLLRYEATVGAGLPVIATVLYLMRAGDPPTAVEATLSGTLGYLMSRLEEGLSFSQALRLACHQRYTEPDPRDDLSGLDVARKALILARTIGLRLELSNIAIESLYPPEMGTLSVEEFLRQSDSLNSQMQQRLLVAGRQGEVLRYLARVDSEGVTIGLRSVPLDSPFGALKGTDNLVSISTARYTSPLRIAGPGAGPEVTAAGVLGDVLDLAVALRARCLAG